MPEKLFFRFLAPLKKQRLPGRLPAMKFIVSVLGLLFVFEAIPYVLFPEAMRRWLARLSLMPAGGLRASGLFALILGLFLCWLGQRSGLVP